MRRPKRPGGVPREEAAEPARFRSRKPRVPPAAEEPRGPQQGAGRRGAGEAGRAAGGGAAGAGGGRGWLRAHRAPPPDPPPISVCGSRKQPLNTRCWWQGASRALAVSCSDRPDKLGTRARATGVPVRKALAAPALRGSWGVRGNVASVSGERAGVAWLGLLTTSPWDPGSHEESLVPWMVWG